MLFAAVTTLFSAHYFYGSLLSQTEGAWVAPLDDVFIHFDYARSIATGHPFEWSPGNGYSSGATSIVYPFVLALGYLAGVRELDMVPFAAVLACTFVFVALVLVRFAIERARLPRIASYAFPLSMFGMGALAWSLWSGMEVALFVLVWSAATLLLVHAREHLAAGASERAAARWAWGVGGACAVMDLVRPEALVTTLVFAAALSQAWPHATDRAARWRVHRMRVLLAARVVMPVAACVLAYAVANKVLTGESAASGAIVKLILYKPYLTLAEKLSDYRECLRLATAFTLMYHMSAVPNGGLAFLALALVPLLFARTRGAAIFLWAHVATWVLFIAQNEQLRWQNQRYVMPAAAWFMLLVAFGIAALTGRERPHTRAAVGVGLGFVLAGRALWEGEPLALAVGLAVAGRVLAAFALLYFRPARALVGATLLVTCALATAPRLREQRWFFGRAARNIRDQQVSLGLWLREQQPPPRRVLLNDAGAIPYMAHVPAIDAIGLGGYRKLPFARAKLQGTGAILELLERIPEDERPDVMAILPSWFDVMPIWFGRELKRFPAVGNVICGDYEHVVYSTDFSVFGSGDEPRSDRGRRGLVLDALDVADLVSESEHRFVMAQTSSTEARLLPDPLDDTRDVFDVGRRIEQGHRERFVLRALRDVVAATAGKPASLVFRFVSDGRVRARISIAGQLVAERSYAASSGWEEDAVDVPADVLARGEVPVEIESLGVDDFAYFHVWLVRTP